MKTTIIAILLTFALLSPLAGAANRFSASAALLPGMTAAKTETAKSNEKASAEETSEYALDEIEKAFIKEINKRFEKELAAEPVLTDDGQVDLSGYTDDELYDMIEQGIDPNEAAGIYINANYFDDYDFDWSDWIEDEADFDETESDGQADADIEAKAGDEIVSGPAGRVVKFSDEPWDHSGFTIDQPSPEDQALIDEMAKELAAFNESYDPAELESLGAERELLEQQLSGEYADAMKELEEAMSQLEDMGIDLNQLKDMGIDLSNLPF